MFGVFQDVNARRQAEESHELLAGEMSHRVKNLLAIACGLTEITARSSTSAPEMAKALTRRLDLSHSTERDCFVLVWAERGGPPVARPGAPDGYGSRLVRRCMTGQLGGSIEYDWSSEGVIIALRFDPHRLS